MHAKLHFFSIKKVKLPSSKTRYIVLSGLPVENSLLLCYLRGSPGALPALTSQRHPPWKSEESLWPVLSSQCPDGGQRAGTWPKFRLRRLYFPGTVMWREKAGVSLPCIHSFASFYVPSRQTIQTSSLLHTSFLTCSPILGVPLCSSYIFSF